ncbi:hemerythrin domain-containing protein [Anaeromyxobacter oryzae]|uniref:Cation-binding protein n=1 Tax=Anaeromyxobacter oryzae TaxID=2918170 RepID=A0ABN6MZH6_9BACT|nr:hemerythrin domain-containing protein [Anaeromyxobacter oryzae]BDG06261.1 cation-binding protein [Anaeromyxobacter oryzae]
MDAIETLMNEHRTIERVLDALVGFADETVRKGTTEKEELSRFVTFLREYADASHHAKEEGVLFPSMIAHGFPAQGGPVAVMLHEHDDGRALVSVLATRAGQDGEWTAGDRRDVAEHARAFSDLLRGHIHKEDAILYPMAVQRLPEDALEDVSARCGELDAQKAAAGERLLALADALVSSHAHAVHPDATPGATPRFGCCG